MHFLFFFNRPFSQRRHIDGQLTHEKMLNINTHQRNASQNHMRYHLTPVRMAIIKKITSKCVRGCERQEATLWKPHWWECKLAQSLWKTMCWFLKKLKRGLPYYPAISLLGIFRRKQKQ